MTRIVVGLSALLLAALLLYSGNGLQGTLLAVRGASEGFSNTALGLLMSTYFVGFILGSWFGPGLVASVGHIRVFTALASIASASALAHAFTTETYVWLALRVITGFCFAGLAMVIESWINEKATASNRGQVLSVYRIVDLSGLALGQTMLILASPERFELFALVSILISLALVPVALTRSESPQPVPKARINLTELFAASPVAAIGSLLIGLANTCFWAMGPVFLTRLGFGLESVSAFMTSAILGAVVVQWPLGWISDKMDRRITILATSAMVVAACLGLALASGAPIPMLSKLVQTEPSLSMLLIVATGYGAFAIPAFGLCVAHANDLVKSGEYVKINSGLLMLYGLGAISGPLIAAQVMDLVGPSGLFLFIALAYLLLAVTIIARLVVRTPTDQPDKEKFAAVSTRSAAGFELHPGAAEATE